MKVTRTETDDDDTPRVQWEGSGAGPRNYAAPASSVEPTNDEHQSSSSSSLRPLVVHQHDDDDDDNDDDTNDTTDDEGNSDNNNNTRRFQLGRTASILSFMGLVVMISVVTMVALLISGNLNEDASKAQQAAAEECDTCKQQPGSSNNIKQDVVPHPSSSPPEEAPSQETSSSSSNSATTTTTEQQQNNNKPPYWIKVGTNDLEGQKVNEHFGYSFGMSADGMIVAGGSPYFGDSNQPETGQVHVFAYDLGEEEQWMPRGNLIHGAQPGDQLGSFVSMSADGSMLAASSSSNIRKQDKSGYVVVYRYNHELNEWIQVGQTITGVAENDQFGSSVILLSASSQNNNNNNSDEQGRETIYYLAAGATRNDGIHGNLTECGHVRVFRLDNTDDEQWKQLGQVLDGQADHDWFGESVALAVDDNDGSLILAAGSKFHDAPLSAGGEKNVGQVRVFMYNAMTDSWLPHGQELYGDATASHFGVSVSLSSSNGNIMAVGSDWKHTDTGLFSGSVSVYEFDTATNQWKPLGREIHGQKGYDEFGWRVALSGSGHTLVAGSPYHKVTETAVSIGQARVFHYDAILNEWIQLGQSFEGVALYCQEVFQTGVDPPVLGYSVAISEDGKTVATGDPNANPAEGMLNSGEIRVLRAP